MNLLKLSDESGMFLILLGNLLVSILGLLFTYGASIKQEKKSQKKWWILFWLGLILYYLEQLIYEKTNFLPPSFIQVIIIDFTTIVSIFIIINYLDLSSKLRKRIPLFLGLGFLVLWFLQSTVISNLPSLIIAFLSFLILGYIHRHKDLTKALLVVTYGIAQIPPFMLDSSSNSETAFSSFLVAIIPLKLTLISAIYSYLDVKMDKEKNQIQEGRREQSA